MGPKWFTSHTVPNDLRHGSSRGGRRELKAIPSHPIPRASESLCLTLPRLRFTHMAAPLWGPHPVTQWRGFHLTRGKNEERVAEVICFKPRVNAPIVSPSCRRYKGRASIEGVVTPTLPPGGQAYVQHVLRRNAPVPHPTVRMCTRVAAAVNSRQTHPSRSLSSDQRAVVAPEPMQ
jgi:hypothetical protein